MSTANVFSLALESYQRLLPNFGRKFARFPQLVPETAQAEKVPSVEEALSGVFPLPPHASLLGLCEDGVPFLLDLHSKETGSLLVTGDPACEKRHQLQVIVESAMRSSSPHELQIAVLTRDPEAWAQFRTLPGYNRYFLGVQGWFEQGANDLIQRLVALGEDRSKGRHPGATILLVIDDLTGVLEADLEYQDGLHQLLDYGPALHIRPVASLDSQECARNPFWSNAFHTFLIGKMVEDVADLNLGFTCPLAKEDAMGWSDFNAFTGENWMKYSLPVDEME